jgi:hypothetical protein
MFIDATPITDIEPLFEIAMPVFDYAIDSDIFAFFISFTEAIASTPLILPPLRHYAFHH